MGTYFRRKIDESLEAWATAPSRKPLLLRGARQTGKTSAVRALAQRFQAFIEVNFERTPEVGKLFAGDLDIPTICQALELRSGVRLEDGKSLLFLDEIQECPRAITALRYFYEQRNDLHVVAAGSLLEFAFGAAGGFGVGRIRNLFIHPFSFREFVEAVGQKRFWEAATTGARPIDPFVHETLLRLLRDYCVVGGMPAAVLAYVDSGSFLEARREQLDILVSLKADFDKYRARVPAERILRVLASAIEQTGRKFVYANPEAELSSRQAKEAAQLLEQARLLVRVTDCHANGLPLGGDIDPRRNKFLFFDVGLYLCESGLDLSDFGGGMPDVFVNRGALVELFVGLELQKMGSPFETPALYYWHREARGSSAEVDYLMPYGGRVLPIEVKSGKSGAMRSVRLLMEEKQLPLAVRTSQENLSAYDSVRVIPLYLISEFPRLLSEQSSQDHTP